MRIGTERVYSAMFILHKCTGGHMFTTLQVDSIIASLQDK